HSGESRNPVTLDPRKILANAVTRLPALRLHPCERPQRHALRRRDINVAQTRARTQDRRRQRIHPSLPRASTCMVRATRDNAIRNCTGESHQGMETQVETRTDPEAKSVLARSVRRAAQLKRTRVFSVCRAESHWVPDRDCVASGMTTIW